MSRNGSGTYTLPSGNPVVSGTLIEATWANSTLSDIASALTDSLSRSGQGGMTAALRLFDGTSSVPGLAWGSETTTGWYRAGAGDMRLVVTGSEVMKYLATGVTVTGTIGVSGAATLSSTLAVTGTTTLTGAATLTANPTLSAGTANGVAYLNGSKVLTSGSALTFNGTAFGVGIPTPAYGNVEVLGTTSTTGVSVSSATSSPYSVRMFLDTTAGTANIYTHKVGTGLGYPLAFSIDGSEQMRLTSTGLGIGTSSPSQKLHVYAASGSIRSLTETGNTSSAAFTAKNSGESVDYGVDSTGGFIQVVGAKPLLFYTNATERMRLDATGILSLQNDQLIYNGKGLAFYNSTNANYYSLYNSSGTLTFSNGTGRMYLDASGNLGIGTTSPSTQLHVNSAADTTVTIDSGGTAYASVVSFVADSERAKIIGGYQSGGGGYLAFNTDSTGGSDVERARIDSSGNFLVGTTSTFSPSSKFASVATGTQSAGAFVTDSAGWQSVVCWNKATSGTIYLIEFGTGTSYAARGSITYNGTSVAYNTTSDYRLKENVKPMRGALAKVAALKPVTYTWKADGSEGEGFIAHELQEVCPNAVAGEKDAVDVEGNPKYQGIDTSFLVATLTSAIQEQQAIIESLKADVAALKAAA